MVRYTRLIHYQVLLANVSYALGPPAGLTISNLVALAMPVMLLMSQFV